MPLLKCRDCMHEWEGKLNSICDWCGGNSRMLEKETPFEKCIKNHSDYQEERFFGENIREAIKILKGDK